VRVSDTVGQLDTEATALVSEGLEAPAVYRELSTEYADLGRLLEFLAGRSFSGLVRVTLERGGAHVLLFRGRPQAAQKYGADGVTLVGADALERTLVNSRVREGKIWVHELPDELFPESWWERHPIVVDLALPAPRDEPFREKVVGEIASEHPGFALERESAEQEGLGNAEVWAEMIEQMYAQFRKYRGPGPAARLEAQVNAALGSSGARLDNGRVTGHPSESHGALQIAAVGCAAYIRYVAGLAFLERSLQGTFSHLRVDDRDTYRGALGL
jgi:hypothetical protein